ncbi:hypothetical protein [Pseudolactococcus chungangensis]|uniref:hypothetical protein n=1 Tax=Pseudolactococcus chungangensis TaxID=451457 RepID=UPI003FA2EAB7
MSENKIKLQINIFGDFSSIQPNMETIRSLTKNLEEFEFLPQYFQENSLTIKNVEGDVVDELRSPDFSSKKRLRLSSIDENYIIEFSSNIISINVRKENDKLEDEISKIASVSMGELRSSRIGIIIIEERDYIPDSVKPSISYYDELDELDEFEIRLNRRKKINVNNVEQLSNVIINISKPFIFKEVQNKLVQYVCDINTIPENEELRFSSDDVISFLKEAKSQGISMFESLNGD